MSVALTVERIETDATHWTTTLATDVEDIEHIDFPTDWATCGFQKMMITSIALLLDAGTAGVALDLDVVFYATNLGTTSLTDIFDNDFIQVLSFEATDANEIGAAQTSNIFYYETQTDMNMPIDYEDKDNTSKIHIGIINRTATAYTPATDKLKVILTAEPVI